MPSSLSALNTYSNTVLTFTDLRTAKITFDRVTPTPQTASFTIGGTFTVPIGINITDIILPAVEQVYFQVNVSNAPGATVTFPTLPVGYTVTTIGAGVYRVSNIQSREDWDLIKNAVVQTATGYTATFNTIAFIGYETSLTKSWTINATNTVRATLTSSATSTVQAGYLFGITGTVTANSRFITTTNARYFRGLSDQLRSAFALSATATPIPLVARSTATINAVIVTLSGNIPITSRATMSVTPRVRFGLIQTLRPAFALSATARYNKWASATIPMTASSSLGVTVSNVIFRDLDPTTLSSRFTITAVPQPQLLYTKTGISGEVFGSGLSATANYFVVGSPRYDTASTFFPGRAQVYNISDGSLRYTLDNPNPASNLGDRYGDTVSMTDTYIAVASEQEGQVDGSTATYGAVYVYNNSDGSLRYTVPAPTNAQVFGTQLSINAYHLFVTALTTALGSAYTTYVYDVSTGSFVSSFAGVAYTAVNNTTRVAMSSTNSIKSYTEPSLTLLASGSLSMTHTNALYSPAALPPTVGAMAVSDSNYNSQSGRVYVYSATDGGLSYTLENPNNFSTGSGDFFGNSIAMNDAMLFVSAPLEDSATASPIGIVYGFVLGTGQLALRMTNPNTSTPNLSNFAQIVRVTNTHLFIGAPSSSIDGKVYVYKL